MADAYISCCADYTVYYPLDDEELWDVAKRYKVPLSSLEAMNGGGEGDRKNRYLIIPRREKTILNEII